MLHPDAPYNTDSTINNTSDALNQTDYTVFNSSLINNTDFGSSSNATAEFDSCDYSYGIDFFYTKAMPILQASAFLIATNSEPLAKAAKDFRTAPAKIANSMRAAHNKIRGWCGCGMVEPEITAPAMRDEMMRALIAAHKILEGTISDEAINSFYEFLQ